MWQETIDSSTRVQPPSSLPPLIWKILESRGVTSEEEAHQLMAPKLADLSHPFTLHCMEVAIERLVLALQDNEQLAVYGDFDLDGTSGAALLSEGLQMLGFKKPIVYQPNRLSEGYGFHAHAVETLSEQDVSLIVTVDVGITAIEACEKAKELGVDVIISDHHQPKEILPDAVAVINPNQKDCHSTLGHLSGTGVGYYILLGLNAELKKQKLLSKPVDLKSLLDFFAIGTVTDMVPLVRENRVLVKHGIQVLSRTKRPGLKALLKELKLYGEEMSSADLAIGFAPKLNALSRLEAEVRPIDLYLEKNELEAQRLCDETMAVNQQRVTLQKTAEALAFDMAKARPQKGFVWVYSDQFHKGVIGLVATKLSAAFGCPAFVGALIDGKISGSARAPKGMESLSVLEALDASQEALTLHGGHHAAAGFQLEEGSATDLEALFEKHFSSFEADGLESSPANTFDAEARLTEINAGFMKWYSSLEPFGTGFEIPVLKSSQVQVAAIRELKGGHLKLTIEQDLPGHQLEAIWFSPPKRPELENLQVGSKIDIYYQVQWNRFAGRKTIQLLIQDIQ